MSSKAGRNEEEDINKYFSKTTELVKYGWGDMSLRAYQVAGVNWIIDRVSNGQGCILGDEMGLGKTCQTIAVLTYIHGKSASRHPHLVVCPRSVLENWQQEFKRFAPGLKTQIFIGEKEQRQELAATITKERRKGHIEFDVLITTYEICLKDSTFLHSLEWNVLVVDEAHRLKNLNSLLYKTLSEWDFTTSVLLTGTPVQNNLRELYALLSFIAPKKFPPSDHEDFEDRFLKVEKSASVLHKLLKPYLLLRRKNEVLKDLPNKSQVVLTHGISKLQVKLYKAILTKDVGVFESSTAPGRQTTSLMNILMQLRKCVNHPYLFDGVEPEPFALGEHLVEASEKLVVIDKLLKHLKATGHKVLMFSQMVRMLDILQDYLGYRGYSYERLDGSVRGEERYLAVQSFNTNEDTFVFLLSTKAGGQGINLTSADTVIFVDSDFNPQNDLQAAARAHRIGQTRPVKIIRLVSKNTVEEIILNRAEEKLKLTSTVIKEGEFSLGAGKQALFTDNKVKLLDILKYGVDELFGEGGNEEVKLDLKAILGPTSSGEWQPEEGPTSQEEEEDEGILEDAPQSMYVFEGTDYKIQEPSDVDKDAFERLIETGKEELQSNLLEDRPSRNKRQPSVFMGGLPEVSRQPRRKLTPEELAERKKKREEATKRRAKEVEEQEMRRAQAMRKKRDELWKTNGYKSCNVELEESEDEEDEEDMDAFDDDADDDGNSRKDILYVSGDVTQPKPTNCHNNIIVHCADDSGGWGKGGIFTAISSRSTIPEEQYELAGQMKDLALGDCHVILLDKEGSSAEHSWVALIIAQHRDKHGRLSGIKLPALREGLEKVNRKAQELKASVHLPRIGHDTPAFNWYGTEKLIKKHLASKGIPTYIYYYPRKHLKRKENGDGNASKVKVSRLSNDSDDIRASASGCSSKPSKDDSGLLNIFTGCVVYIHKDSLLEDQYKHYRRYVVAFDGDITASVTKETTHMVVSQTSVMKTSLDMDEDLKAVVVSTDWLDDCLKFRKLLKTENYEMF